MPLADGGFILAYTEATLNASDDWAGRFWARTWCNKGNNFCETGDCGFALECGGEGDAPPVSLAEITLRGSGGLDSYRILLIDGFNTKVSIEPIDERGSERPYGCRKAACDHSINNDCPAELKLPGSGGWTIGCKSACLAFNTDQYCCRGDFEGPEGCRPSDWSANWSAFFRKCCPDAPSYANDEHSSTFTCIANMYHVVFG